ncbi:MAG: hypothetical protein ACOH2B_15285, partial [Burkholderiaceae bacterium]
MARPYRKRAVRNLHSAGTDAAKLGSKAISKSIVGLSKWVVTDHTGMGTTISNMPKMGFVDSVRYGITYLIGYLFISIIGAVLT